MACIYMYFTSWSKWQAVRLDCLNPLGSNSSLVITLILNYVLKICNFYLCLKLFSTVLAIRWQRKQSDCVKINRLGVDDDLDLNKNIHFTFREVCVVVRDAIYRYSHLKLTSKSMADFFLKFIYYHYCLLLITYSLIFW